MKSVSSRIWTRVAVSISYDDNHYNGVHQKKLLESKLYGRNTINEINTRVSFHCNTEQLHKDQLC